MFSRPSKEQRRVVVTGMGAITPLGLVEDSWQKAVDGISGISKIEVFDPQEFDVQFAGQINYFNPEDYMNKKDVKKMDRFIQLCLASSDLAIKDSGLDLEKLNMQRVGTIIGNGIGGLKRMESQHRILFDRGPQRITPFFIPSVIANLAPGQVSIRYGFQGPNFTITSACASGAHAIGEATKYIRDGLLRYNDCWWNGSWCHSHCHWRFCCYEGFIYKK